MVGQVQASQYCDVNTQTAVSVRSNRGFQTIELYKCSQLTLHDQSSGIYKILIQALCEFHSGSLLSWYLF